MRPLRLGPKSPETGDKVTRAMNMSTAVEGYWLARKRDFSQNTINDYSLTFRRFVAFTGDPDIETVGADHLHKFLNHLDEMGLAPKTQANAWTALSSLWTWAAVALGVPHVVSGKVKRPKTRRVQPVPFTQAEVRLLLASCDQMAPYITNTGQRVQSPRPTAQRDRAMMMVMLDTGIRVSELTALKIRDYTPATGEARIGHGKGDKARSVFLGQAARQSVWLYLSTRLYPVDVAPLFISRGPGNALDRIAVLRMVKRAGERVGVVGAHPHKFRHTFAINFLRNGGNPLELQKLLGHEKMDTVRLYVDYASADLEAAQRKASPADGWKL